MKNLLNSLSAENFQRVTQKALDIFDRGECCPLKCGGGEVRPCGAVKEGIKVASFAVHDGEEPPVSGWNGAGNIFFSGCSVKCIFCQNWPISHGNNGKVYSLEEFQKRVLNLMKKGVHNINLVTPDHYLGRTLKSLAGIREEVNVPLVFNSSGAHTKELFEVALEVSDIFLLDVKYSDDSLSAEVSGIKEYVKYNTICLDMLLENEIKWVENSLGILQKGLIIRHLVLPGHIENSIQVIEKLLEYRKKGLNFKLSLMSQYFPAFKAVNHAEIGRRLTKKEYSKVVELVEKNKIDGWIQPL
ncbi:MAG: radical SAM protein [bacterium]